MKKFKIEYYSELQQSLGTDELEAGSIDDAIEDVSVRLKNEFSIAIGLYTSLGLGNVIICSKVARFTVVAI